MGRNDNGGDVEAGNGSGDNQLYPGMTENPQLRWAFIRKVYTILTLQMIITAAIGAVVVCVKPVSHYLTQTGQGTAIYIALSVFAVILLFPLHYFQNKHPVNLVLLLIFTIVFALLVGCTCATQKGMIVLEAAILTTVVVAGLTLYTFWAVKRGQDFGFLGPFLFCGLLLLLVFSLIQIFLPMGKLVHTIWSLLGVLLFSGYIIYDTDNLIKRFTYDEYITAAICLYLDIMNLFIMILGSMGGADN